MKVIYHRHPLHPFLNKIIFPFPLRLTTESRFTEVDRSMGGRIPLVGKCIRTMSVKKSSWNGQDGSREGFLPRNTIQTSTSSFSKPLPLSKRKEKN